MQTHAKSPYTADVQRREFVDWARGFAVVAMVLWHTADGWLVADARSGQAWVLLRFVGGLAAPSFLFLAGTGLALGARPHGERRPSIARGLEILLFGYVLRFQTWMIDAGAVRQLGLVRAWLPLGVGYVLLFAAIRAAKQVDARVAAGEPKSAARVRGLALAGTIAVGAGLAQVPWVASGRLPRLLQVDVLQAIGASLVLLTWGERAFKLLQRPALAMGLGAAIALLTEFSSSVLPGPLPAPIAAYFGRFASVPGHPPAALFPLLPWFAYACFGAAFGCHLRQAKEDRQETLIVGAGMLGALLALATSEAHHYVQVAIASHAWSVHPLRVAFRSGLVLVALLVGWLWVQGRRGRVLVAYGRASLRIYWAHLLVAYGLLGSAWYKRLGVGEWAARVVLVLAFMWLLSQLPKRAGPRPSETNMRAPVPRDSEASNGPAPAPLPPRRGRLR